MVQSKSRSRRDDSEDDTPPPPKSKSKSKARQETPEDDQEMDDGGDDEEEYEIEKIVKARKKNGTFEYFVKWKGYESDENTWVMEADMAADELLADYKKANADLFAPPKPRKSVPTAKKPPPPESSSDSEDERDRERERDRDKERAKSSRKSNVSTSNRASTSGKHDSSRNKHKRDSSAMDEDEDDEESSTNRKSSKKSKLDRNPLDFEGRIARLDDETNLPISDPKFVNKMSNMSSWEKFIVLIETVESRGKDKIVYFRTKHDERGVVYSSEMKTKSPILLIEFYESHLRWREATGPEDSS